MGDRYTITERVDQGGMAEVFRGVAESLQGFKKAVAIKRILPNLTKNKKFIAMFLDEARVSLNLQHANIVQVFDIGRGADESSYFIVMEYVDGANLKHLIDIHKRQRKIFKISHTLYILLEVCKGLAYAHEATDPSNNRPLGIVHRDISPPNILLSKNGEVKLVDFGLAKATSQIELTDPGVVKGKFSYLSPEAASGVAVDNRADIFAVGILLWEMLTGQRLFYGETDYQTVELVRQARVPSIRQINPNVDPELEEVALKALARDPNDRFQGAGDMQDALAHVLFGRGLKVTSHDISKLVKEAASARDKNKKHTGKKDSLIDVLINDEIGRFTSLEEEQARAQAVNMSDVASGDSPLDPGAFVDTRSWVDDFGEAPATTVLNRNASPPPRRITPPPAPVPVPPPRAATRGVDEGGEIESLQQILEPTGVHRRVGSGGRGIWVAFIVGMILALSVIGGYFVFREQLFGKPPAVPEGR